jgi:rSAM/selenodomain-associated transferase 1
MTAHPPRHDGRALVMFARVPELGRVKTRLAVTVGDERALAIYRGLGHLVLSRTWSDIRPSGRTVVAHTPDDGGDMVRAWLGDDVHTEPQGDGDFGARMARALQRRIDDGAECVVAIGMDCPEMSVEVLDAAFCALGDHDVVFGPATDGGYYLVGVHRRVAPSAMPALFHDVPWSSPHTLQTGLERASREGLRVMLLEPRSDIDTAADWEAWQQRLTRVPRAIRSPRGR